MLSIILGLGIASLFRTVCKDKNCIIFKAPPLDDIKDKVYKYNDKCYKYNPVSVKCDASKKIVEFA
jgi:hypothetical protein